MAPLVFRPQVACKRKSSGLQFGINAERPASHCSCGHSHSVLTNNKTVSMIDPTHTIMLRSKFARDIGRRLDSIKKDIWTSIVINDCFGLNPIPKMAIQASLSPGAFAFKSNPAKVEGFMNWLHGQENQKLLGLKIGEARGATGEVPWANVYIDSAYKRGMKRSEEEMNKAGIKKSIFPEAKAVNPIDARFNIPIHANRVAAIHNRIYTELKGITDVMDKEISTTLAQGLIDGKGTKELARELNNRIEKAGGDLAIRDEKGKVTMRAKQRATILARTEIIRAHHVGTIQTYREAGLEGVIVKAEWSTAMDDRVCPACADLEKKIFRLDEIENMIPLHPQCRCVALPVIKGFSSTHGVGIAVPKEVPLPLLPKAILPAPEVKATVWVDAKTIDEAQKAF